LGDPAFRTVLGGTVSEIAESADCSLPDTSLVDTVPAPGSVLRSGAVRSDAAGREGGGGPALKTAIGNSKREKKMIERVKRTIDTITLQ
jgi:hypothetical protein